MSLHAQKIASIARELTHIDRSLDVLVLHARFLASKCVADNLDLRVVNELRAETLGVHARLTDMSQSLEAAKRAGRSVPNGPQLVASARGMGRHVERHLARLEQELQALSMAVERHINEPGRHGDAALATGPIFELFSFVQTALEMVAKAMERRQDRASLPAGRH